MRSGMLGWSRGGGVEWYVPRFNQGGNINPMPRVHDAWYRLVDDVVEGAFTVELTGGGISNSVCICTQLPVPCFSPALLNVGAASTLGAYIGRGVYIDTGSSTFPCDLIVPAASNTMTFPGPNPKGGGEWAYFQNNSLLPLGNGGGSSTFLAAINDVISVTYRYNTKGWHRNNV